MNKLFFPARPDFCRGSDNCQFALVPSALEPIHYSKLKLVVNGNCASSCDDFVWRMKRYAGAKTYGQLPATDGTYARLHGYLFIDQQGKISSQVSGEGDTPDFKGKTLLVRYQLPISKTVDSEGNTLEGSTTTLDFPLAITTSNFASLEIDNLQQALIHQ